MASPRRRVDARQRKQLKKAENRDNVLAMKVLAGAVVGVLILVVMISLGSEPEDTGDKSSGRKERGDSPYDDIYEDGDDKRFIVKEGQESQVPAKLAQSLMLAIANLDQEKVEKLVSWPLLFGRLANDNAWEAERRWENLDDAGREALKTEWLFQLLDEDLAASINLSLKDDIIAGAAPPNRSRIGDVYGEIMYIATDPSVGKDLVVFHIKAFLLEGYTPENDYHKDEAWRIGSVAFDVRRAIGKKRKTKGRSDIGADIGKAKKRKRKKRRRFKGPVEADPGPVAWVEGTTDATKSKIQGLIAEAMADKGRASMDAQRKITQLGKPAIPGLLNQIAATDLTDRAKTRDVVFLVNMIEEITGEIRGVTGSVRLQGLAPPSPAAITTGLRRWYGWWNNFGSAWVKEEYDPSKETWEQLEEEDAEEDGGK